MRLFVAVDVAVAVVLILSAFGHKGSKRGIAVRSVASASLVLVALVVVFSRWSWSGPVSNATPSTTSLNQPRATEVIVHLKPGTSASQASRLPKRMINLDHASGTAGSQWITGTDWNYRSPRIVRVYIASSETLGELHSLLPAIRKMPHVAGVTAHIG
jgi:hypothetical protein